VKINKKDRELIEHEKEIVTAERAADNFVFDP
jgi:hypothetical protein